MNLTVTAITITKTTPLQKYLSDKIVNINRKKRKSDKIWTNTKLNKGKQIESLGKKKVKRDISY